MDHHLPRATVSDRLRTQRISRRLDANRFGTTTRGFHRSQQAQQISFGVALVLSALAGLLLLAA
ncbi:hypothetical protein BH23ACT9_BH23ACT9_14930 [soil metagenome]